MATFTQLINLDSLSSTLSYFDDSELTREYFFGMGGYVLLFVLFFWRIVPDLSASFIPAVKTLDEAKYFQTMSDMVSTIPSTVVACISLYNYFRYSDNFSNPALFESCSLLSQIMSAYFIMDTVYKCSRYPEVPKSMVVHHIIGFTIIQMGMYDRNYMFEKLVFCLQEVANPFINIRLIAMNLGISKQTKTYVGLCFAMFIPFFLCRILPIPFVLPCGYHIWLSGEAKWTQKLMHASYVTISCMNIYWFSKMCRALVLFVGFKTYT